MGQGHAHRVEHGHEYGPGHAHGHAHGHGHGHGHGSSDARRLGMALALTVAFLGVEVVAGWLSGSLALLSDAGHMLTDAGALLLALVAQRLAARSRTDRRTFGYRRAEILAALLNGAVLAGSAIWIIFEAVQRFRDPPEILGVPMLIVAGLGLIVNLLAAWILAGGDTDNANVRAAAAHVLSDAAGSVAALVAAILVIGWNINSADAVVSIAISLLILWGAWRLIRGAVDVLMEGTPEGIEPEALSAVICATPGVESMHDLHVWAISSGFPVVTVHVVLDGSAHGTDVARSVAQRLEREFGIEHATVQPEAPEAKLVPASALVGRQQQP